MVGWLSQRHVNISSYPLSKLSSVILHRYSPARVSESPTTAAMKEAEVLDHTRTLPQQTKQAKPFKINLLENSAAESSEAESKGLFPSTYRNEQGDLDLVKSNVKVKDFLASELSVAKFDSIYNHLWLAGLPVPPRPLHYQLVLQREIVVCEKMDMHLVWGNGRIYLKPIPRFLLSPAFWETYLECVDGCDCSQGQEECTTKTQRTIALGFLFTYAALISSQRDFLLAQETHLLPPDLTTTTTHWINWQAFVEEILTPSSASSSSSSIYKTIHRRFYYGELRLNRLNTISLLTRQSYYLNQWADYSSFLRDQLGWLAATTIYIALALTALQAGMATERLQSDGAYMAAAYGFSVFALLGPVAGGAIIVCVMLAVGVVNWRFQRWRAEERFRVIRGGDP